MHVMVSIRATTPISSAEAKDALYAEIEKRELHFSALVLRCSCENHMSWYLLLSAPVDAIEANVGLVRTLFIQHLGTTDIFFEWSVLDEAFQYEHQDHGAKP